MQDTTSGTLYLIPTPIGEEPLDQRLLNTLHGLRYFVVERARTARRFIKSTNPPYQIEDLYLEELNEHTESEEIGLLLEPLLNGHDLGLMSEAGCPGIADPGAELIAAAHSAGITIRPLIGPSSIFLALMASGMSGQRFRFHGYLTAKKSALSQDLRRLERDAAAGETQIFIEAPYRNRQILEVCAAVLRDQTRLCIALNLLNRGELVVTRSMQNWKKTGFPDTHKMPAVFLLG